MADLRASTPEAGEGGGGEVPSDRAPTDPRAVRVTVGATSRLAGEEAIVVSPLPEAVAPPMASFAGHGVLGGAAVSRTTAPARGSGRDAVTRPDPEPVAGAHLAAEVLVDGRPAAIRLEPRGPDRALLRDADGRVRRIVFGPALAEDRDGVLRREVVVDGWRVEVEVESERRAALRARARRGREATGHGGPTEIRAIIPGRVVGVSVAPGDALTAGQQILVVEAMKMQNELRSPREGVVRQVAVGIGRTIEVGDLLLVIE